ncbi:MAG: hypothetical protein EAZ30_11415 [Betaproteobacteria bacterium]|nr:MAG: hypothetical protein EAZ30_11415 [Betaproteobacteria bacterium]
MQSSFEVVTDIEQIAKLNRRLAIQLKKTFKVKQTRVAGYPSNHSSETVFFESNENRDDVRAWSPYIWQGRLGNMLLFGNPRSTGDSLEISLQINFPERKYNRMPAGAFVRDQNGEYFVAHRGNLTRNNPLHKDKVFREFPSQTVEAKDGTQTSTLILVAPLNDSSLVDRLWTFAKESREAADRIVAERENSRASTGALSGNEATSARDDSLKLRDYFDEYAGAQDVKGYSGGKRVVTHGDIVRDLEVALRTKGSSKKAQAIDLSIVAKEVDLYEVKTSISTTDIYTGVGQLLIHGESIKKLLKRSVRKFLVLPEQPPRSHKDHMSGAAGISVVTYEKVGATFQFKGLQ